MSASPQSFVFIVTYGRSGSTVLQNLLNRLPGYLVRGENENALGYLVRSWAALSLSRSAEQARESEAPTASHQPWYGIEKADPDAYGRHLANFFIETVLQPGPDTRVCGFKEIRWHLGRPPMVRGRPFFDIQLDFVRQYFPDAKFIFNTREIDEVLVSGWWPNKNPTLARQALERANALYKDYQAAHPDCCLSLQYNDFKDNADALKPVFEFLGEPYDRDLAQSVLDQKLTHLKGRSTVPDAL